MGKLFRMIHGENVEEDEFGLMQSVQLPDVKSYLLKEFKRGKELEETIKQKEARIEQLEQIETKYEALLVIQDNTSDRIKRLEQQNKSLKEENQKRKENEKKLRAKITDIKINAEKKIKELKVKKK